MSRKLVLLSVAFALAGLSSAPAFADRLPGRNSVAVSYADLDLTGMAGVETLTFRMKKAADKVCGRMSASTPAMLHKSIRACHATALGNAVASINAPLLTAVYERSEGKMYAGL